MIKEVLVVEGKMDVVAIDKAVEADCIITEGFNLKKQALKNIEQAYKKRGIIGGIFATLGVISPSLLIIMTLAQIISRFENAEVVVNAFKGIRIAVVVLILNAVIKIGKSSIVDKATAGIFLVVLVLALATNVSPVVFVLIAAAAGILIQSLRFRKGGKR